MDRNARIRIGIATLIVAFLAATFTYRLAAAQASPSVSYSLVTAEADNSPAYTPVCVYKCFLPVEFSVDKNTVFDKSQFGHSFLWVRGNAPSVSLYFGKWESVQKQRMVWALGCEPYEQMLENGTIILVQNCTDTQTEPYSVTEWVWYPEEQAHGMSLAANEQYRILLQGYKSPQDSVDVVPEIVGKSLTEFATWNGVTIDVTDAIILHYVLNSTNLGTELSQKRCNLTIQGSVTYRDDAWGLGESMFFDNNVSNYLQNDSSSDCDYIPSTGDFTVISCGNLTKTAGNDGDVIFTVGPGGNQLQVNMQKNSGGQIWHASNTDSGTNLNVVPRSYPTTGTHVCMVFWQNSTLAQSFFNATVEGTDTTPGTTWGNGNVWIGIGPGSDSPVFGSLDFVSFFNRTLNTTEIEYLIGNATVGYGNPLAEPGASSSANESAGRAAIEAGIAASTASSGTTYTDRQAYIRYLNGTQKLGTFDKVLVEGSQRWLFNYNTTGADRTGMEGISPALFVWENGSLTAAQITAQVSSLINSTNT